MSIVSSVAELHFMSFCGPLQSELNFLIVPLSGPSASSAKRGGTGSESFPSIWHPKINTFRKDHQQWVTLWYNFISCNRAEKDQFNYCDEKKGSLKFIFPILNGQIAVWSLHMENADIHSEHREYFYYPVSFTVDFQELNSNPGLVHEISR